MPFTRSRDHHAALLDARLEYAAARAAPAARRWLLLFIARRSMYCLPSARSATSNEYISPTAIDGLPRGRAAAAD